MAAKVPVVHARVAACYAQLERRDEAREAVAAFEQAVERERREGNRAQDPKH